MKSSFRIWFACAGLAAILAAAGCGTVASVRPMGRGKSGLTLSSAGPVAPVFGMDMPIPYALLRYRRGLSDNTDLHFGLHATMLYLGNLGLDFGLTRHLFEPSGLRPALALEGSVYVLHHIPELGSTRAFPELSVIGRYNLVRGRHALYFGSHGLFQYDRPYVILAPFVGLEIDFGRVGLDLEGKWYAPTEDTEFRVVDYKIKPFDRGAVGFAWGFTYRF